MLLKAGALIDARDDEKHTPLHYASAQGHMRVVEILSARRGHKTTTELLRAAGAYRSKVK